MGCDIHLYVEKLGPNGWESADNFKPDPDEPGRMSVDYEDRIDTGRNYGLFAILADVRNGRGFAGVRTGDGYEPISPPRGLPDDTCALVRAEHEAWGADAHSASYFTVSELLAYDWTQTTTRCGWIELDEYERWDRWDRKQGESPNEWSGMVAGREIVHLQDEQAQALLTELRKLHGAAWQAEKARILAANSGAHVFAEWVQPYYKVCSKFLSETMPKLWRFGASHKVRIVFWFDN